MTFDNGKLYWDSKAKGSTINEKKKTNFTISEYIKFEKQKLREHNAKAHEDDRLDWSDWKSELTSKDTKEYGIFYNSDVHHIYHVYYYEIAQVLYFPCTHYKTLSLSYYFSKQR